MKSQREIFAENLKRILEQRRMDQVDLANEIGVSKTSVNNWVKGLKYPRIDKIQLIAEVLRVNKSELTDEQASNLYEVSPRTVRIPVLGKIACGKPLMVNENFEGYVYRSPESLPSGEIICLIAKGDSMAPTIPVGAEVLIRKQDNAENGDVVAVRINGDEEATLKRLKRQGENIILMPDNPAYEPILVDEDNPITLIGKVVSYEVKF